MYWWVKGRWEAHIWHYWEFATAFQLIITQSLADWSPSHYVLPSPPQKKSPTKRQYAALRVISHLNVSSVHSSDGGLYRCQAENTVRPFFSIEHSCTFFLFWDSVVFVVFVQSCPARWVWWLTHQGSMCTGHPPREVSTMSLLFPGSIIPNCCTFLKARTLLM